MDCGDVNGNKYIDCPMYGFHLPYKICTDPCYIGLKSCDSNTARKLKKITVGLGVQPLYQRR